jgi:hypothetical protein
MFMGIANPYYGGNFDTNDGFERCAECNNIITSETFCLGGKHICRKCNEKSKDELIVCEGYIPHMRIL